MMKPMQLFCSFPLRWINSITMWPSGGEAPVLTALLSLCIWPCPLWCCSILWRTWWWAGARWHFGLPQVRRSCWAGTGTGLPGRWSVSSAQGDSLGCDASVTWHYGRKGQSVQLLCRCANILCRYYELWLVKLNIFCLNKKQLQFNGCY